MDNTRNYSKDSAYLFLNINNNDSYSNRNQQETGRFGIFGTFGTFADSTNFIKSSQEAINISKEEPEKGDLRNSSDNQQKGNLLPNFSGIQSPNLNDTKSILTEEIILSLNKRLNDLNLEELKYSKQNNYSSESKNNTILIESSSLISSIQGILSEIEKLHSHSSDIKTINHQLSSQTSSEIERLQIAIENLKAELDKKKNLIDLLESKIKIFSSKEKAIEALNNRLKIAENMMKEKEYYHENLNKKKNEISIQTSFLFENNSNNNFSSNYPLNQNRQSQ